MNSQVKAHFYSAAVHHSRYSSLLGITRHKRFLIIKMWREVKALKKFRPNLLLLLINESSNIFVFWGLTEAYSACYMLVECKQGSILF